MRPRRIVCGVFAVTIALATVPALAQERQATLGFEPNAVGQGNADLPPRDSGKVVAGVPVVQTGVNAHTTVTGGLAIHFGAPAYRSGTGRTSWEDVLRQRIHRDVNIVISQTTTTTTQTQPVPPPPPPPPPELPPENF